MNRPDVVAASHGRLTTAQKRPVVIRGLVVDQATAGMLALYSKENPAQYGAGLLIKLCRTAAALNCKPEDVPAAAVVHACTCGR